MNKIMVSLEGGVTPRHFCGDVERVVHFSEHIAGLVFVIATSALLCRYRLSADPASACSRPARQASKQLH